MSSSAYKISQPNPLMSAKERLYLIVLSADHDREKVSKFIDTHPQFGYWFFELPYSIFVKSSLTSREIWQIIEAEYGIKSGIVVEITNNHWGRLQKDFWKSFPPSVQPI